MLFAHLILDVWFFWGVCVRDDDLLDGDKRLFLWVSQTFILKETETML